VIPATANCTSARSNTNANRDHEMATLPSIETSLPKHHDLFYGGSWHSPQSNEYSETYNPGNGKSIAKVADASANDVDRAVLAANEAFSKWRSTPPTQRAQLLRKAADILRQNAQELALLDALNTGNPVAEMLSDASVAAANLDYFAGLIPMLKGETIPVSEETFHYTLREPLGVVARIVAYNHPVMFAGAKMAAPLAAGNTVIIKPPEQAPLSCLKLAEILADVFPPGVLNVVPGRKECGQALSSHSLVRKITLIGSVPTGKAIMRAAADTLKPTLFELGGKNALIAFPDADKNKLAQGIARGMNFTWAGQSCGSTSRVFLHETIHDEVVKMVCQIVQKGYKAGLPTDMSTTMGPVISQAAQDRVLRYIESGKKEGARLVLGGQKPSGVKEIEGGFFIEPTIFTDVTADMEIAREEIFGPVMSVFRWSDEKEMMKQANTTPYGLTASVYTSSMGTAQRTVKQVEAGYVWVNQVGRHFLGVPFGGYKESGGGREECLDELFAFTQTKSVNVALD
jgi:betaine-aldehyde dehydrogenase